MRKAKYLIKVWTQGAGWGKFSGAFVTYEKMTDETKAITLAKQLFATGEKPRVYYNKDIVWSYLQEVKEARAERESKGCISRSKELTAKCILCSKPALKKEGEPVLCYGHWLDHTTPIIK